MDSTTRRSVESILSKTIQLNNAGVVCLVENNNIEKAVKLFAMAFSNHEKLKLQANRMIITSSSSITTTVSIASSSSPKQQQQRSRSTKKQPQHQQLNDLFVRYRRRSSSSSASSSSSSSLELDKEDDNDVVLRDPIRLPSIEDIMLMMKCTNDNDSNCDSNAYNNNNAHNNNNNSNSNNAEEIEEHEYSQIIGFLSTCHTYNLALAYHLCGLELLRSTSNNSSNKNAPIFDRAGRLYELTMRLERTRSKLRQQQKQNNDKNDSDDDNDINTWFTPQILLACLNNLAHLHYRTNNHIRSRSCYLQIQLTTKKLWDLKRQQRQEEEEEGLNINNNDDCDDDGIGHNHFSIFWTNACRGLSRLIASSSSSRSPRTNNKQQHYVTKSSAAAAA
jgi:hypothetical protein